MHCDGSCCWRALTEALPTELERCSAIPPQMPSCSSESPPISRRWLVRATWQEAGSCWRNIV